MSFVYTDKQERRRARLIKKDEFKKAMFDMKTLSNEPFKEFSFEDLQAAVCDFSTISQTRKIIKEMLYFNMIVPSIKNKNCYYVSDIGRSIEIGL